MDVSSPGHLTDLALLVASGSEVEDRGTHLVVRTPDNPGFHWGNFLLLAQAPVPGGEREVLGAFRTEFPDADHVAIAIDQPSLDDDARARFEEAGLEITTEAVLTATGLEPGGAPEGSAPDVEVRALASDDDWEARALLAHTLDPHLPRQSFLTFARARNAAERRLVDAGLGQRFGAFVDGELVSSAAAFRAGPGVASFQDVETHPDHRRRGHAALVLQAAARHALEHLDVQTLVIVAEEDGDAVRLYRRLGFTDVARQVGLELSRPR